MPTRVRSYSKINLGLRIGSVRPDGYHALCTLYQTIGLYDVVTVSAKVAAKTLITLASNSPSVPVDGTNTAWRMVESALRRMGVAAEVEIHIQKNLPVQGGLGAGSANAIAALLGLERELNKSLSGKDRILLAGEIGSDCPLFLCGGASVGLSRGEVIVPFPDFSATYCVVAAPSVGVSTPLAFKAWDARMTAVNVPKIDENVSKKGEKGLIRVENAYANPLTGNSLTGNPQSDRLDELSRVYASVFSPAGNHVTGASGVPGQSVGSRTPKTDEPSGDLAGSYLSALVRTGISNDFQEVAFEQHPSLRDILHALQGNESTPEEKRAMTAMLSGSGSSLFGLYRTEEDAEAARQRVEALGTRAMVTTTLPRSEYWRTMFEEQF